MEQATHHYHLITGEVIFRNVKTEEVNAVRVNGILADEGKQIPVRLIAKSQQILQANFVKKAEVEIAEIQILDCIILNITYLGEFTPEEFHKEPEGLKAKERTAPASGGMQVVSRVKLEDAIAEAEQK